MPLGFGNSIFGQQVAADAGFSGSTDASYALTNSNYAYQQYQQHRLSYVGDDSSGQPVFFSASKGSSGHWEGVLIKRNNDDTISESSLVTYKSSGAGYNLFGGMSEVGTNTNGDKIGVFNAMWQQTGPTVNQMNMYANTIDVDNLTFGTTLEKVHWEDGHFDPSAGFGYVAWTGKDGVWIPGYRKSGMRLAIMSVSTTAITETRQVNDDGIAIGDGVYQMITGFPYPGNDDYHFAHYNGNASQGGLAEWDNASTFTQVTNNGLSLGISAGANLPIASDHSVIFARQGTSGQVNVYTMTWDGTLAATLGTEANLTDNGNFQSDIVGAGDTTNNKVHLLYKADGDWSFQSIGESGGNPSQGSVEHITATTTNWQTYGHSHGCYANSAQGELVAYLINPTSSNSPEIYIKHIS